MSDQQREPTEEEIRAAYEAEIKRVRVEDVVVQTIVSLINLGGRKAGLAPGAEDERDLDQLRQAVDAVGALLPLVEPVLGPDLARIREALSQLQLAYARGTSGEGAAAAPQQPPPREPPAAPGQPGGDPQRSSRLWVPGQ